LIVLIAVVAVATIVLFLAFFTFHDQSGVGFGASLNATTITQNQTVRVNLYDWNTLDFKNSLPESDAEPNGQGQSVRLEHPRLQEFST